MQAISREIHELLTQGVPITTNLIITEAAPGTKTITLYPEDLMLDEVIIRRSCSSGKDFALGGAEASELTATIINEGGKFNKFTFEGATVDVRIKIGTSTIRGGTFVIDERPAHGDLLQIKAFDNIARLMCDYDSDLAYPATVNQILQDACSKCNLTLDSTTITNGSYEVANKPDRATYQEVVRWCAEIAGGFAYCDDTGALRVGHYTQLTVSAMLDRFAGMSIEDVSDETGEKTVNEFPTALENVDAVDVGFYSMKRAEKDVSISGVTYEDDDDIYIAGTDKYTIDVSDNQLLADNPTDGIYLINEVVNGIAWRPASELITVPLPYIWPGDLVIVIEDSKPYTVLVTDHVCNITKESSIVASGEPETIKGYATAAPLTAAQRRTISKISKEITRHETNALEQETLNLFNTIAGSLGFHETTVIEDGRKITYVHDLPALEDSMVIATMTEQGWASTTTGWNNGSPAWIYGATFDGSLVMRVISTVGLNADWIDAGTISADHIDASDLKVKAANVTGTLSASQINTTGLVTQYISDTPAMTGGYGKIGYGADGGAGVEFHLGASRYIWNLWQDGKVALIVNGTQRMGLYDNGYTFIADHLGVQRFVIGTSTVIYDASGISRLGITSDINLRDTTGRSRLHVGDNGTFYVYNSSGNTRIGVSTLDVPYMRIDSGHEIGVDSGGAYYMDFSVKTYLKNVGPSVVHFGSQMTGKPTVSQMEGKAYGKVVTIRFTYQPAVTGFDQGVVYIPSAYAPSSMLAMTVSTSASSADVARDVVAYIGTTGSIAVVTTGTLPSSNMIFTITYVMS